MVGAARSELLKRIAHLEEGFSLSRFNALHTGGTADYFTEASDAMELIDAVKGAIDAGIPYLVVGMGEGILFADGGFPGLVIHNKAAASVMASDRSQIIVDSGMPLRRFITEAAGRGFGGLTSLYSVGGTVGGAIFANSGNILSSVRYVTVLVPPSKMKVDVTLVRYKADWLTKEGGELTRLQKIRATKGTDEPYPVIINAHIQLTSVRSDELIRRLNHEASGWERSLPRGETFGPLFEQLEDGGLESALAAAAVEKIRVDGVAIDRKYRNYIRQSGKARATSSSIWQLVEEARQAVWQATGIELKVAFERVGAW